MPRTVLVAACFLGAFLLVYLIGFFNLDTDQALAQFVKGMVKFLIHFLFLARRARVPRAAAAERYYWRTLGWFVRRDRRRTRPTACSSCSRRAPAANLDAIALSR